MTTILHVYDAKGARRRRTPGASGPVYKLPVVSIEQDLIGELERLVAEGQRFTRIVFDTPGRGGRIRFGDWAITAAWIRASLAKRGFDALCAPDARIYFKGCDAAEGEAGWDLLAATAEIFLGCGGGKVVGQVPGRDGKPAHGSLPWGRLKTLHIAKGGKTATRRET